MTFGGGWGWLGPLDSHEYSWQLRNLGICQVDFCRFSRPRPTKIPKHIPNSKTKPATSVKSHVFFRGMVIPPVIRESSHLCVQTPTIGLMTIPPIIWKQWEFIDTGEKLMAQLQMPSRFRAFAIFLLTKKLSHFGP